MSSYLGDTGYDVLADPDAFFFSQPGSRAIEGISFHVEDLDCLNLPQLEFGAVSGASCLAGEFSVAEETGESSALTQIGCGSFESLPHTYTLRLRISWWLYPGSEWSEPFSITCTEGEPPPPPPPGQGIQLFPQ